MRYYSDYFFKNGKFAVAAWNGSNGKWKSLLTWLDSVLSMLCVGVPAVVTCSPLVAMPLILHSPEKTAKTSMIRRNFMMEIPRI